ncbi:MAG: hypothetical protein GY722_07465 [bacterium]|nr:hypothetical protein [bacterium]
MLSLIDRGKLCLPPDMTPQQARALVRRAAKRQWIVDRHPGYEHGLGVVKYLARYIRGGVLRNSRLLDFDGEEVTFRVSRMGESLRTATVPVQEFIRRILQHVPPHGFRTVRGVGLYAPTNGEKLRRAGEQVGYLPPPEEGELEGEIPSREPCENPWDKELCSVCGQKLIEGTLPRADPLLSADAQPRPWIADQIFPVRGPPGPGIFLEELS